eukprot:20981-Rhodomonas_salina.1
MEYDALGEAAREKDDSNLKALQPGPAYPPDPEALTLVLEAEEYKELKEEILSPSESPGHSTHNPPGSNVHPALHRQSVISVLPALEDAFPGQL